MIIHFLVFSYRKPFFFSTTVLEIKLISCNIVECNMNSSTFLGTILFLLIWSVDASSVNDVGNDSGVVDVVGDFVLVSWDVSPNDDFLISVAGSDAVPCKIKIIH